MMKRKDVMKRKIFSKVFSQVLVCGGLICASDSQGSCDVTDLCYRWNPELDEWTPDSPLTQPRLGFLFSCSVQKLG